MRISLEWLRNYVQVDASVEDLAERLTIAGLEVEMIEVPGDKYRNFVLGTVRDVKKHPQTDRLTICTVDCGDEIRQIICGAPNVAAGQSVIVALPGAVIPHDQHDPSGNSFTLRQTSIRSVESFGMICSAYELGIGEDKDGILVLPGEQKPGTPLGTYLGMDDTILEIGITPNRPDALSHFGIAREVAAIYGKRVHFPKFRLVEGRTSTKSLLSVRILDTVGCPRYSARIVRGIKVAPSPKWLEQRLTVLGIRPVNNIVDVSNYVLMEFGHPLHAFDYGKISDRTIVVRKAAIGEAITTLDHKLRTLDPETLLICDPRRALAIAGVMGGADSEISENTSTVVIESAYFDPGSIRRTSKRTGLSTDASQRFERGADPNATIAALDRAAWLMQAIAGGEVTRSVVDVYRKVIKPRRVSVRVERLNNFLGVSLAESKVCSILNKLSLQPKVLKGHSKKKVIVCNVPTFRPDVTEEIDLIEEVARIYGYNNIPVRMSSRLHLQTAQPQKDLVCQIRDWFIANGYCEVVTNSMQDVSTAALLSEDIVKIANPISKDMAALRTSMIPSMLEVVRHNIYHGSSDLRLFEIGKVYHYRKEAGKIDPLQAYSEQPRIAIAWAGRAEPLRWDQKQRNFDIFDIKGEVESLGRKISLDNINFIPYSNTDPLNQLGIRIEIQGCYAGLIGLIDKKMLTSLGIEEDVYVAELLTDVFLKRKWEEKKYHELPKFPVVERDLAVVVDQGTAFRDVLNEIAQSGGPLLMSVDLFDLFHGEQIDSGKKSLAFRLRFMAVDHTLTQGEIDRSTDAIIQHLATKLNAVIRK